MSETKASDGGDNTAKLDAARDALVTAARDYLKVLGASASVAQVDSRCYVLVGDLESIKTMAEAVNPAESPTSEANNERARSGKPPLRFVLNPMERKALSHICDGHQLEHGREIYESLRRRGLVVAGMGGRWHATPAGVPHCEAMKRMG
jgi:hypothetical protein